MSRRWVVNASPLIALAKTENLPLLMVLSDELVIPSGVSKEILSGAEEDSARKWISSEGNEHIVEVDIIVPTIAGWDLGRGESEVLSYAYTHPGFEAIVDDRAARHCAESLGVPVRGTLGVLLLAKKEGRLENVKAILGELQKVGFRIDSGLVEKALRLAGE